MAGLVVLRCARAEGKVQAALRWKERLSSIPLYQNKGMSFWRAYQGRPGLAD